MAGRPTLYSEEMLKKAEEYLDSCKDDGEIDTEEESDIDEELEPQSHGGSLKRRYKTTVEVNIPTVGGLASYLRVARSTLYVWAKEVEEFSDIMERLGSEQENRLIQRGLGGQYNPTIAKVLLTKHGYTDKLDMTSKDEKLPTPIFANIPPTSNVLLHDSNQEDTEPE